jgi:hypothetical protein
MLFFDHDPFRGSLLARSAAARLGVAFAVIICLWGAVFWAVALP